ncbi:TcpQ domain-containing protein [Paraglaciecola aquimarina]|uniref:TcpQ domain-containing protein n=1 Tax=Paraglaciecola aquimarina TaxID=1235557 RepID=A0ABU3T1Y5_9ALTE|nr:TcpQ domain-containing protein [Paraglaciecola aquimarina]MDU0356240.1 TcpQ domain-containing protein [Paraglaciecola aquimarina]
MENRSRASDSLFWLKHVMLAIVILVVGGIVLYLQSSREANMQDGDAEPKSIENSMRDFYADYKLTSRSPKEEDYGDFVVAVKAPEEPLTDRLIKMESIQQPMSARWEGEHKYRSFKSGSTLRSVITDYAESEGMRVIWELEQDFIIKHTFQLDNSILGSLRVIASAIDANFDGEVKAYMCPRQRSLVITQKIAIT